jgi:hypothetical protein
LTARLAATLFAALVAFVCSFQLALALGAPWGEFAMGGGSPGVYPATMRLAAVVQSMVLAGLALIILSRAGVALASWRTVSNWAAWAVVVLLGMSVVLNLITPSPLERLIWAPVAIALFLTALRVASSK